MSENARTIWRNVWLNGINELSSIELQRRTWLNPESDYYWSYQGFMDRFFDTIMMAEDPQYFIRKKFITGSEHQAIKGWYETLINYEVSDDEGDEFDHVAILNDPKWLAIVQQGKEAKNALANLLTGNEKTILTAVKNDDSIPDYVEKLEEEQEDWEELMDEDELEELKQEFQTLNDEIYGTTPEERQIGLNKVKWLSRVLNALAIGCAAWVTFKPEPYDLAIQISIFFPLLLLGIFIFSKGIFRIDFNEKKNSYPNIAPGLISLYLAVFFIAQSDFKILDYTNVWICSGVAFIILAFLILRSQKKERIFEEGNYGSMLLPALLLYAYLFSASILLNQQYNQNDPVIYKTKIIKKAETDTSYTIQELQVEPWGNPAEAKPVDVTTEYHKMLEQGDSIFIFVTTGALDIPYYQVIEPIKSKE